MKNSWKIENRKLGSDQGRTPATGGMSLKTRPLFGLRMPLMDRDLAELYHVETKVLKQAVRRNIRRFPSDFMFELTKEEFQNLRSQFVTSSWGGSRYVPMAFTEQGVAMLSSVLNSERAIQVNIQIMRAFNQLRKMMATHEDLKHKIEEKWDEFLESNPHNPKIFAKTANRLYYSSEQLIPEKQDERPSLLLVLGNPASQSVANGMFFSLTQRAP